MDTFELRDALREMRAAHPLLQAASRGVPAAEADVVATQLWRNPVLAGVYTPGIRRSSYDRIGYIYYGLTQFVELANAPGARRRAAKMLVSAARADVKSLDVHLSLDLELAMVTVEATRGQLYVLRRALALLEEVKRIVDDRVRAGAAPTYDENRIAITAAMAQADLREAEAQLVRAEAELDAAIGPGAKRLRGRRASYPLREGPPLPELPRLLQILERRRPDLEAARQRASSAHERVSVARRSVVPGAALTVAGGYGAAPGQVDVGVGLSVELPVIDHGQGTIVAARARAMQAEARIDSVFVPAGLRIRGLRAEVETRRGAYEAFVRRAVASGEDMLHEAQAGYLAGRFSVLELADAYAAWRDARLRLIELASAARAAEVNLGRELGVPLRELAPE